MAEHQTGVFAVARLHRFAIGVCVLALALVSVPGAARAESTARANGLSGPDLTVTEAAFREAFSCTGDLADSSQAPVLLAPDYATAEQSYGWNFGRQLPSIGVPTCTITLEHRGTDDLQVEAEYVVRAVRDMSARSGKQVTVIGHAFIQLAVRWAAKFWPDVASRIDDSISIAAPEQGTDLTRFACGLFSACPASAWQARTGSIFLERINSGPLPDGPSFTTISTRFDELIFPQPQASTLPGASNIVLQDLCPGRLVDHFTILGDAVTYELVLDAMAHDGPADPDRLPADVCSELFMPGVIQDFFNLTVPLAALGVFSHFPIIVAKYAVNAEPDLRSYARR